MREVVLIDIGNDNIKSSDYKPDEDPKKFKSQKTGRGPLTTPKWWKDVSFFLFYFLFFFFKIYFSNVAKTC